MSMGSEDTFIFSVLLQTKILQPLLEGLGVYVTKPGKYAMVRTIFMVAQILAIDFAYSGSIDKIYCQNLSGHKSNPGP